MAALRIHPKAYLRTKRNVRAGLLSRTKILTALEHGRRTVKDVCKETNLTYKCVTYHLKTMGKEKLVERSGTRRRYSWKPTLFGQQVLEAEYGLR